MTTEKLRKAEKALKAILKDLREVHTNCPSSDSWHFVLWFLLANFFSSKNEDDAKDAVIDGAGDKGADAVIIDHKARRVIVVQAKHHKPPFLQQFRNPPNICRISTDSARNFCAHPKAKWGSTS